MKRYRRRSGRIADYITGFWSLLEINMVRHKMLNPQRSMGYWQTDQLKREIRLRLMDQYGYQQDHMGCWIKPRVSKPRVRYKLTLRRWPVVHTLPSGRKYEMFQYVYMLLLVSCFFLSSTPAGANDASSTSPRTDFRVADGRWFLHLSSAWTRPVVFATPSPWENKSPPIRFLSRPKTYDEIAGCRMYMRHLEKQAEYKGLVDEPKPVSSDWRKFWAWLTAIGTIGLGTVSAISYGQWRSFR